MSRGESRQYWAEQLSEYWDSGFSIQEYCELKELPFENTKRWIRVFEKERNGVSEKSVPAAVEVPEPPRLEMVEVKPSLARLCSGNSGIRLKIAGVEVLLDRDFDGPSLSVLLSVLGVR